jgi:hypothetical protein
MNKTILNLLSQLNRARITYAIGGSTMLKIRLFELEPHDIDIFVSIDDYSHTIEILKSHAKQIPTKSKECFTTKHFSTFKCDDIVIDIMAGFAYEHQEGTYSAIFDQSSISVWMNIDDTEVPLMSLEEWFVLYSIMCRKDKVDIIENYWKYQGVEYPVLLFRQLTLTLPIEVKHKILSIIKENEVLLEK